MILWKKTQHANLKSHENSARMHELWIVNYNSTMAQTSTPGYPSSSGSGSISSININSNSNNNNVNDNHGQEHLMVGESL
jgi:hypothetical protein